MPEDAQQAARGRVANLLTVEGIHELPTNAVIAVRVNAERDTEAAGELVEALGALGRRDVLVVVTTDGNLSVLPEAEMRSHGWVRADAPA